MLSRPKKLSNLIKFYRMVIVKNNNYITNNKIRTKSIYILNFLVPIKLIDKFRSR